MWVHLPSEGTDMRPRVLSKRFDSLVECWRYWRRVMDLRRKAIAATLRLAKWIKDNPTPSKVEMAALERLDEEQQNAVSDWDQALWDQWEGTDRRDEHGA